MAATLCALSMVSQAQTLRSLTIGEFGIGSWMDANGTVTALQTEQILYNIAAPGSPANEISVTLFITPWDVTHGDVILTNSSGHVSDVIRFLQPNDFNQLVRGQNYHGIIFFSDQDTSDENPSGNPSDSPADIDITQLSPAPASPSGEPFGWLSVTIPEVTLTGGRGNGADYLAGTAPNLPGTDGTPPSINYAFISDAVPEPATGMMVGMALAGMSLVVRRRK